MTYSAKFKTNNPGCPCCFQCVVFRDEFELDGYDGISDLGNDWTIVSGSWSASTDAAETTTRNAKAIAVKSPSDRVSHVVQVDVRGESVGDTARVFVSQR